MGTDIRPVVSEKRSHALEKHRYYELVHFCRQYDYWHKALLDLSYYQSPKFDRPLSDLKANLSMTERLAYQRMYYTNKIELIDSVAREAGPFVLPYLMECVTKGTSYARLNARLNMPCSRGEFYQAYRKFFWILHKRKD